jgi:hypothetical protein
VIRAVAREDGRGAEHATALFPAPVIKNLRIEKLLQDKNRQHASTGRPGDIRMGARGKNYVKDNSIVMRIVRMMMVSPRRLRDVQFNVAPVGDRANANTGISEIRSAISID